MAQKIAYYVALVGDLGYMPDSHIGPIACHTRRELVEFVNDCLEYAHFSQRTRRQVSLPFVWRYIQKYKSCPKASFTLESVVAGHSGIIEFRGMSESEFNTYCN